MHIKPIFRLFVFSVVYVGEKVNCVYLIKNGLIRLSKRVEKPQVYIAPNSSPSIFGRSSVSSVSSVSLPTIVAKNGSPVPAAKDTPVKDSSNSFAGLASYQEGNEAEEESGGGDGGGSSSDVMMAGESWRDESSHSNLSSSTSSTSMHGSGMYVCMYVPILSFQPVSSGSCMHTFCTLTLNVCID